MLDNFIEDFEIHYQKIDITSYKTLETTFNYIKSQKGKRVRPSLAIISYFIYNQTIDDKIYNLASALEIFHNFTLVHDDIMDNAPTRRGVPTINSKWNNNLAILTGDLILIKAYQLVNQLNSSAINSIFSQCAIDICVGQQMDMDFSTIENVQIEDYVEMVRLKTAVLLGNSLKMGALLTGVTDEECDNLYCFGEKMGIAFQIQDDYLDLFADNFSFGKQKGGDIIEGKKSFLYLKTLEIIKDLDAKQIFIDYYNSADINTVESLMINYGIPKEVNKLINSYKDDAMHYFSKIQNTDKILILKYIQTII